MGIFQKLYEQEHLVEGKRLIATHTNGNRSAKVYKNSEDGEHVVQFHTDGKHHKDADYHTDDKDDAHGTAKHFINKTNENTEYVFDERVITEGSDRSEHTANTHLAKSAGKHLNKAKVGDVIHYTNDAGHKQKELVHADLGNGRYGVKTKEGKKFFVHHSQVHDIEHRSRLTEASSTVNAMPGHSVTVNNYHREGLRNLKDGEDHKTHGDAIIHKSGDKSQVHIVKSKREGNVVHMHDYHTNKHIATVNHSDL